MTGSWHYLFGESISPVRLYIKHTSLIFQSLFDAWHTVGAQQTFNKLNVRLYFTQK